MTRVGAPWPVMGELVGEGREGEGEGERWAWLGGSRGAVGGGGSAGVAPCCLPVHDCLLYVREEIMKDEGEEKREKRKEEGKGKKEKEKKGKFSKFGNF
jgi:predicted metal-binding transcription factor (methanogenesis marker protein 9)